jgi:hypothetical protein
MIAEPPNEYELTHDKNGKEVKKQISTLGGDKVDFIHNLDGKNKGKTEVIDKSLNSSIWAPSSAIRGYSQRGTNVGWGDITSEYTSGTGPEKSLFLEANTSFENCGATGSCLDTHSSIWSLSNYNSGIGYELRKATLAGQGSIWIDWGLTDVVTTGDMWSQMIGSSWGTSYKFDTGLIMYMVQDTKNKNSLFYHLLGKEGNIPREAGKITPYGNTFQTYIWFESVNKTKTKVNQYENVPTR